MPKNLKIVPRLLSFAAAAFVLLAVNADAQQPATRSVVIPPIPWGQARIWVYRGSQPSDPLDMYRLEGVTVNGARSGSCHWAGLSTATLRRGITLLPARASKKLIPVSPLRSTWLPDRTYT
jgi:hypothetical protein